MEAITANTTTKNKKMNTTIKQNENQVKKLEAKFYTVNEFCAMLGFTPQWYYKNRTKLNLRVLVVGTSHRLYKEDVDEFIKNNTK